MNLTPLRGRIFPIVAVALGVLIVVLFLGYKYTASRAVYTTPRVATDEHQKFLEKDSDNDGLKDWEEELWKTDPLKADTDGDGTSDGDEIKAGRDPITKGPGDKMTPEAIAGKVNSETEQNLTDTAKFSRELFVRFIAEQQKAGKTPDPAAFQDFVNSTLSASAQNYTAPKEYTRTDITITPTEDAVALKKYGNAIGAIITKKPNPPLEYELVILNRATEANDPTELAKLDANIREYRRIERDIKATPVPESAIVVHLGLLNAIGAMRNSIEAMRLVLTDPIKVFPHISRYSENVLAQTAALRALKKYFTDNAISFEQGEYGYALVHAI